jgi:hypothetical protein
LPLRPEWGSPKFKLEAPPGCGYSPLRFGSDLGGRILKWPTRADCKSAGLCLRRFESFSYHHVFSPSKPRENSVSDQCSCGFCDQGQFQARARRCAFRLLPSHPGGCQKYTIKLPRQPVRGVASWSDGAFCKVTMSFEHGRKEPLVKTWAKAGQQAIKKVIPFRNNDVPNDLRQFAQFERASRKANLVVN